MQFNNGPDHPMSYNTIDLQNNENNEKVTGLILFAVGPQPHFNCSPKFSSKAES